MISSNNIKFLNKTTIDKNISPKIISEIAKRLSDGDLSDQQYFLELILSAEFLSKCRKNAVDYHLYFIHHARLKLVATLLPKASVILDLGGANGSIYDMGYPYKFDQIVVVDLPPENRTEMYKDLSLRSKVTSNGPIDIHFGDMSDLSFVSDNSVDLVWSGESIEHIPETSAINMISEAYRVLKPGGYFCLDTPNRILTKIHTKDVDIEFIHPEHKIEYYPKQLQKMLRRAGFKIIEQRGICEMENTIKSKEIDYTDFIFGNPLPHEVNSAYMQYYACQKPYVKNSKLNRVVHKINRTLKNSERNRP